MLSITQHLLGAVILVLAFQFMCFLYSKIENVTDALGVLYSYYAGKLEIQLKQTSAYKRFDEIKSQVNRKETLHK